MKAINKICMFVFLITLLGICFSCNDDENVEVQKTTDFIPVVADYEYFIEGVIEDKTLNYRQINYDWTNVSNKYFSESEETWLQAYSDSLNTEGRWVIRVSDIDIETIDLPYTLQESDGSIRWFDSRVDLIIQDQDFCQGVDNGCTFSLTPDTGEIIITKVENNIIEGEFSGKAIVVRTGSSPGQDENLFHEIENGNFRIMYTVE